MSQLIEQIRQATIQNNNPLVRKILHKNMRYFSSLTQNEQCIVLNALVNLRETKHLMNRLDDEKGIDEIANGGIIEFKKQFILSRTQMLFGCPNIALRILRRLTELLAQNKVEFDLLEKKRFTEILCTSYYYFFLLDEVLDFKKIYPQEFVEGGQLFDESFEIKCLSAQVTISDRPHFYLQKLQEAYEKTLFPINQNLAFLYLKYHAFKLKIQTLQEILNDFDKLDFLKLAPLVEWELRFRGLFEKEQGNKLKAKIYYLKAYKTSSSLRGKALNLSLLDQLDPKFLTHDQLIFLRSTQGLIIKRPMAPHIFDYEADDLKKLVADNDIWLISTNGVQSARYQDHLSCSGSCLDLYSGIYFNQNNKILLTEKRSQLLAVLISKGNLGCSEYELASTIYNEQIFKFSHRENIKNLTMQIKKLGLSIKKKNNLYYYDFKYNKQEIILPIDLKSKGPLAYCQKQLQTFSAKEIEELLQVKRTKAFELLKEWKDSNLT